MRGLDARDKLARTGAYWLEIVQWLIFIAYLGLLYLMASHLWHALKFFHFLAVFVALPLLMFIVLRYLKRYETGNE